MDSIIDIEDYHIPVKIHKEWRSSVRYSLGKKNAIMRIPRVFPKKMIEFELARLENWLEKILKKDAKALLRFKNKIYLSGDILRLRGQEFVLEIKTESRKTNSAKIEKDGRLLIKLSDQLNSWQQGDMTQKLIIKVMSNYFKPSIEKRVREINQQYFQKEITSVKLKNNQTNWGSCSSKKNINLSSRLLLAPQEVLDYVIVHELAHLIEMNHSSKFWNIVRKVMPDYQQKEAWLKQHGHQLIF